MRIRAAQQLALLNREDFSKEVVNSLCSASGPFGSTEKLMKEGAAEVLHSLAEVDAKIVVDLLEYVLGPLEFEQLKEIKGDTRRNLVRALEKITFCNEAFEQGARLMFALAGAENENWGNNATGLFKNLFSVLGGSTEAGPAARLQMLSDVLSKGDESHLPLVVDALLQGINTHGGFRVIGAEYHESRPALKPWRPATWKDAWDYVRECLVRLAQLAARNDAIGKLAKAKLGSNFRALVNQGLIADVERVFATVVQSGTYWPEALESLGHVLVYDVKSFKGDEEIRVRDLIAKLTPIDIASRVRFLVTEMPWDYPVGQSLDFQEHEKRQLADVEALALELLAIQPELEHVLPNLSKGDQRMSTAFGRAIAERALDPLQWMDSITDAYIAAPEGERNFGLLGGFLGGLAVRHPEIVDTFKKDAVTSTTFGPTLPFICSRVGLNSSDIPLAMMAIKAGVLPVGHLRSWVFGGVLAQLPVAAVAPLLTLFLRQAKMHAQLRLIYSACMYMVIVNDLKAFGHSCHSGDECRQAGQSFALPDGSISLQRNNGVDTQQG